MYVLSVVTCRVRKKEKKNSLKKSKMKSISILHIEPFQHLGKDSQAFVATRHSTVFLHSKYCWFQKKDIHIPFTGTSLGTSHTHVSFFEVVVGSLLCTVHTKYLLWLINPIFSVRQHSKKFGNHFGIFSGRSLFLHSMWTPLFRPLFQ